MLLGAIGVLMLAVGRAQAVTPFPPGFQSEDVKTNGATIHVRVGGKGPAVVLLHGFGDTGDMWAPVAAALAGNHTVIVPDLRGMGLSSHPEGGYEKTTQARDIAGVMDALNVDKAALVTHDIGNMVGYALAAQYPERVTRWVVIDAPLPGIGPWDEIVRSPMLWHFNFRGPDVERLVAGPRAHLSRPVLERALRQPEGDRRGDPEPLRRALRAAGRHAFGVQPVRRLQSGRDRQQGARRKGQAGHAGAGARRATIRSERRWATSWRSSRPT